MNSKRSITDFFNFGNNTKKHKNDSFASADAVDVNVSSRCQFPKLKSNPLIFSNITDDTSGNAYNDESQESDDSSYENNEEEDKIDNKLNLEINIELPSVLKPPGPLDLSQSLDFGPKQPALKSFPKTKYGNRWRYFIPGWYKLFSWLEYSTIHDAAFCFACRFFSTCEDKSETFTKVGFKNWKKAMDKNSGFAKHAGSNEHVKSISSWACFNERKTTGSKSIACVLNQNHSVIIAENRKYIRKLSQVLLYTVLQGIAQRGNDESKHSINKGNYLELLELIAEDNDIVRKRLEIGNAKYTSPQIQNEILNIMSVMICNKIKEELEQCDYFALIVDETKDIGKTEQLSVIIRYYLNGFIYERFIGFNPAKELDAKSLVKYIKVVLARVSADINKCVAQTYDGASVMSGALNGVQKLIRDEAPKALYIHCYNHKLNLILVDCVKSIPKVKSFFDLLESLYIFISGSAIHSKFVDIQKKMYPNKAPVELKQICLTRWTAQISACVAVKEVLPSILVLLNKIIADRHGGRSSEAKGLLHQIDFDFILNLCFFTHILKIFKGVSDYLQNANSDISQSMILIDSIASSMQEMRENNSEINNFLKETKSYCQDNDIEIPSSSKKGKRFRKMPNKFKNYFVQEELSFLEEEDYVSEEDYRIHLFIPVIDRIIKELESRFSSSSAILHGLSAMNPKHKNFLNYEIVKPLATHYDVNTEILQSEMKILPNAIKSYESNNGIKILTICEFGNMLNTYKVAFNESYKLLSIALTIPVSSAACERTFSCLRRLKTFMRNKISDCRLQHIAQICIEKKISKLLDLDEFVNIFATNHANRRILLI